HGVALRVASNLRRQVARHRHGPVPELPQPDATAALAWRELQVVLDEELHRLPDRYRAPLVLAYLEGKTRAEAAREPGCSVATLRGGLARGGELLRPGLMRRGLPLSAARVPAALAPTASASALPPSLVAAAVKDATQPAGLVPARVAALTQGVLRTMTLTRI